MQGPLTNSQGYEKETLAGQDTGRNASNVYASVAGTNTLQWHCCNTNTDRKGFLDILFDR